MRRGVSARTLTGLTRRARPRGKAGDPFLLLRNMFRLAQQRGCFSEPVPLQGVPSLKLNINRKQKLCFYNLAVHLPEGRRPQTGSQSQPQESEMSESWQRKTERETKPCELVLWKNLAYLCLYSSPLRESPTSCAATSSSSVHLRQERRNKQINHLKQMVFISAVSYLIISNKLMSGMQT